MMTSYYTAKKPSALLSTSGAMEKAYLHIENAKTSGLQKSSRKICFLLEKESGIMLRSAPSSFSNPIESNDE